MGHLGTHPWFQMQVKAHLCKNCENDWIVQKESLAGTSRQTNTELNTKDILSIGHALTKKHEQNAKQENIELKLHFVNCGTMGKLESLCNDIENHSDDEGLRQTVRQQTSHFEFCD